MKNSTVDLQHTAAEIRARIIEHSHKTGTPHLGSCLSSVDVLTALYFDVMNIDPENHTDPGRDRFVLGKGHGAPALYQVLALRGYYPHERVAEADHEKGSYFGEHPPTPDCLPGIEAATGSLGHGLPIATGMAIANRIEGRDNNVFVLLGDGECNEGSIWEAAMFAGAQKLDRLAIVVDFNKWQATDRSREVMAIDPLIDKWKAFGWSACEVDGHDMAGLVRILRSVPDGSGKPVAVVAHTVKGKGVSFMEDDNNWHYRIPTADEVVAAKAELQVTT